MRVVMIDFDGTITQENIFPKIGAPRENVFKAINTLQERGWTCCLWTCRKPIRLHTKLLKIKGGFNSPPFLFYFIKYLIVIKSFFTSIKKESYIFFGNWTIVMCINTYIQSKSFFDQLTTVDMSV